MRVHVLLNKPTCICFCGCVVCVVVGNVLSRVPRDWLLTTDVIIYSIYKTMYVQNRKICWDINFKAFSLVYILCNASQYIHYTEYRQPVSLLSSIPCKTISPSAALTSPVIFSQPRGDCTSVSLQPWASHINTPIKKKTMSKHVLLLGIVSLPYRCWQDMEIICSMASATV